MFLPKSSCNWPRRDQSWTVRSISIFSTTVNSGLRSPTAITRPAAAPDAKPPAGAKPAALIAEYLRAVHAESIARGYRFDKEKIGRPRTSARLDVTSGQLDFEWRHLLKKLETRAPERHEKYLSENTPLPHPLFRVIPGGVADWERP